MTEIGETRRVEPSPDERFAAEFIREGREKGHYINCGKETVDGVKTWYALIIPREEHDALLADVNRERLQTFTEMYSSRPDYKPFVPYVKLPRLTVFEHRGFVNGKQTRKEALLAALETMQQASLV